MGRFLTGTNYNEEGAMPSFPLCVRHLTGTATTTTNYHDHDYHDQKRHDYHDLSNINGLAGTTTINLAPPQALQRSPLLGCGRLSTRTPNVLRSYAAVP
jgi:hypothetical protein